MNGTISISSVSKQTRKKKAMDEIFMPGLNSLGRMEVRIPRCGATYMMCHYNGGVGMDEERWREVEKEVRGSRGGLMRRSSKERKDEAQERVKSRTGQIQAKTKGW